MPERLFPIPRRRFLQASAAAVTAGTLVSAADETGPEAAAAVLAEAVDARQIAAATLHVLRGSETFSRAFGAARSTDAMFLLGSITKPICMTALMSLFDQGLFTLEDRASRHLPEIVGEAHRQITVRQLLTHTSGLPDQLPENDELRRTHADLGRFTAAALQTPLLFAPGTRYSYSSMGILWAAEIAQRLSGQSIQELTKTAVFARLGMERSVLGLGQFTAVSDGAWSAGVRRGRSLSGRLGLEQSVLATTRRAVGRRSLLGPRYRPLAGGSPR